MTTKLIAALLVALVLFGGYNLFLYWEKVKNEEFQEKKEQAAVGTAGQQLPGLPQALEASLAKAQQNGAQALSAWLKAQGANVKDPRKAWIELDYALLLSRENPAEARRIYAAVKARTSETSPVYKRVQELAKTYE